MNQLPKGLSQPHHTTQGAASDDSDDEIDLGRLFFTLWRGRWIILLFSILALFAGGFYAYFVAVPLYRSTTVVLLEPQQQNIVNLDNFASGLSGDNAELNSEIEVLRGRGLIGKVVDELDLVADPEFNASLRPPSRIDVIKSAVLDTILGERGDENSGDLAFMTPEQRERESAISALLERLSVTNLRQSYVFQITLETQNPAKSALIADTVADTYIENQLAVKLEAMENATRALSALVAEEQAALEEAEAARARFSSSTDLISPEALVALERQLKDSRDRLESAQQERDRLASELAILQQDVSRDEHATLIEDPLLQRIYTQKRPGWQSDFDSRIESLRVETQAALTRQEQQIVLLQQSTDRLETQITQQNADLIRLQQLTREANTTRATYEHLLTRLSETAVQQGVQQADSRVLSEAVIPNGPSAPRKSLILAMSLILGAFGGAALVILRELRHRGFRLASDLEQATGRSVLGQIPMFPVRKRQKTLEYLISKPTSVAAEAVRNLRTALLLSNVDSPPQVIAFTSALSGEGKTTTALALAQNLHAMGKSVLIVEGDMRRRVFTEYFSSLPTKGMVSVLAGEVQLDDVIRQEETFGFDVLVGERSEANAGDLFSSNRFKALVASLRERYDHIIIDTPPVLLVPDAMIIARHADAFIFAVKWDDTTGDQVTEALRQIRNTGQDVTGLALTQINAKGMKRYGYGRGYGTYGSYSGSGYYTN